MRNPYDRLFKSLADDEPRALLHLFAGLPIDQPVEVEALDREQASGVVSLDHLFRVRDDAGERLVQFEFQTYYDRRLPDRFVRDAMILQLSHGLPLESYLLLLVERFSPAQVPSTARLRSGALEIGYAYRVVRVWETDPERLFSLGRPAVLPFVPLTRAGTGEVRRAADQIARSGNSELAAKFMILGSLRYNEGSLEELLERSLIMELFDKEVFVKDSWAWRVITEHEDKGLRRGIEQGLERGTAEEARRLVKRALALRFPHLDPARVDSVPDTPRLEALLDRIITAGSAAEVESELPPA